MEELELKIGDSISRTIKKALKAELKEQLRAELIELASGLESESIKTFKNDLITQFDNQLMGSMKNWATKMSDLQLSTQTNIVRIKNEILKGLVHRIEVKVANQVNTIPRQHSHFPLLLTIVAQRIPAYLCGPAGSGKTTMGEAAATALGLPFYSTSVCAQTTKSDFLGYMDAHGNYRGTLFRKAFETGGVYLLDEIDAGNANVLAVLNSALSNGKMGFPDGMVTKHPDFILIAGANTWGGSDHAYVGRQQLDAATLDRFAFVALPYDTGLEQTVASGTLYPSNIIDIAEGGTVIIGAWLDYVKNARKAIMNHKIRAIISPRASIYGTKLAATGMGWKWLKETLIYRNLDQDVRSKIG